MRHHAQTRSSAHMPGFKLSPNRAANEFYPTPPEATRAFLTAETFDGSIWEPACGKGHIAKELIAHGYETVSTDLADYGYGDGQCDFLDTDIPRAKHIITNPPYGRGLADAFVKKSLAHIAVTGGRAAMLINLASLAHPTRHSSFIKRRPARIYILDECICYPNGDPRQATDRTRQHRYCWAVWTAAPTDQTVTDWLTTRTTH